MKIRSPSIKINSKSYTNLKLQNGLIVIFISQWFNLKQVKDFREKCNNCENRFKKYFTSTQN